MVVHAQFKEIISGFPVAIFKAILKSQAVSCFDDMGEEAEIISQGEQGVPVNPQPFFGIEIGKNASVLPQQTMYIPDEVI
jgi:hypothetical protein